jgi:hypothetical protein
MRAGRSETVESSTGLTLAQFAPHAGADAQGGASILRRGRRASLRSTLRSTHLMQQELR